MAAGAFKPYDLGLLATQNGNINYLTDTIVAVLLDENYTPVIGTHGTYADVSANEIDDAVQTDYAPVVLSGKTVAKTGNETIYGCSNISFGNPVTLEGKYCVLVKRAGASLVAGDLLLGFADLNTDGAAATASSTASTFAVNTPNGLFGIENVA